MLQRVIFVLGQTKFLLVVMLFFLLKISVLLA
jgi:hypothetical protein